MVWPFSRARGKRWSEVPSAPHAADTAADTSEKSFNPNNPRNATPRSGAQTQEDSSLRKRRRSPEYGLEAPMLPSGEKSAERRQHRSRASVENITALPGARRMETSPHLRRSGAHKAAIPYTSGSRSRSAAANSMEHKKSIKDVQKRRLSKRQEFHNRALREEEIRAMSAPVAIPNRDSPHGDLLLRENKKVRRAFSARAAEGDRASSVSIPFQESIHSSMSASSESRGWMIPKLDLFSPRPTVRVSSSLGYGGANSSLSRSGSKKDKMPALMEHTKKRDRRRMAELADSLDASDLRMLMERDNRRRDKKRLADKEKLEAKLKRRASKTRKERQLPASPPVPPAAIHPAFREKSPFDDPTPITVGHPLPSPNQGHWKDTLPIASSGPPSVRSAVPSPSLSSRPSYLSNRPWATDDDAHSPVQTPFDDPVISTAEEVHYSLGRSSHVDMSPPLSPTRSNHMRNLSPLRREYTPEPPAQLTSSPLRYSESSTAKKSGAWSSFFRRGNGARVEALPVQVSETTSFSNTSRDSMSKQPLPPHLIANATRRRSGTPARTQSIFREDLPESPLSLPESRVNSVGASDIIAAGQVAAARRSQLDDPTDSAIQESTQPLSHGNAMDVPTSLASIDSEGSWLTGRPSKRKSAQSHLRSSIGSASRRRASDAPSYEELAVPDDELVRRLTPSPEDDADDEEDTSVTPTTEQVLANDGVPLRRNTSRRKPNLVLQDSTMMPRQGLVAEMSGIDSVSNRLSSVEGSALPSTRNSGSDFDQDHDADTFETHEVVYGRGHARHISSGSAKLLDIVPTRSRSGRNTPDARLSLASAPPTGLQSPPLSPTRTNS